MPNTRRRRQRQLGQKGEFWEMHDTLYTHQAALDDRHLRAVGNFARYSGTCSSGGYTRVEGGALWGLSMALHEGSEFVQGQPKDTNLDTYTPLRMGDVPELEIEFLPSTQTPVGLGEPATTAVAPAIGNAIFAASGARVRHLPIRPEAVRQALAHRT